MILLYSSPAIIWSSVAIYLAWNQPGKVYRTVFFVGWGVLIAYCFFFAIPQLLPRRLAFVYSVVSSGYVTLLTHFSIVIVQKFCRSDVTKIVLFAMIVPLIAVSWFFLQFAAACALFHRCV